MLGVVFIAVALTAISGVVNSQLFPFNANMNFREDSGATIRDNATLPIMVEVLLLRFQNPHGIVYNGKKCDFFAWGCDINAFGYIDIVKPYDEWPGQRDIRGGSDHFWYQGENSSPTFNRKFTITVCDPKAFTAGNLRVHMMDVDGFMRGGDDFINDFNCILAKPKFISVDPNTPLSKEMACDAVYANPLMGLFYQYRMYRLTGPTNCPK